MENKIRTPLRNKNNISQNNSSNNNSKIENSSINNIQTFSKGSIDNNDMIKIYLAEIYTLNKKIENLNNNIEEKSKSEEIQSRTNQKLEEKISLTEEKYKKEIDNLYLIINDLKLKNAILQKESEFATIIEYYEAKIDEYQNKNISNIRMFSQCINKLNPRNEIRA